MSRVKIIVEGATEESFIKNVFAPALAAANVFVSPVIVGKPGHKGGNVNYARVKKDILVQLKNDPTAYCSTMFDLYGLGRGFPGTPYSQNLRGSAKAERVEVAILKDIHAEIPGLRPGRFIPYVQVHEFEALLFSDTVTLSITLDRLGAEHRLAEVRNAADTPEDIDERPDTATVEAHSSYLPGIPEDHRWKSSSREDRDS
jgi:hypothetical protein